MKAIKDCNLVVMIIPYSIDRVENYRWFIPHDYNTGLSEMRSNYFTTSRKAKNNFIKFAKLNGIKNYKFI